MTTEKGSVIGGMLLVAGSCIGAGMLALPIVTGLAGFGPALLMMLAGWAFMTFTALLLVEANGWFSKQVNLLSMAAESLGNAGRWIAWTTYLFLFYSLLVAYIAASGSIFSVTLDSSLGFSIPPWMASTFFTALFGYIVYLGTRPIDVFNRALMAGLVLTYIGMVFLGIGHVKPILLTRLAPEYAFLSFPVLVVSFGFQNMIPSLTAYMRGDLKRVRLTILGGSLMTLAVYFIWVLLVLGIVPYSGAQGILDSYQKGAEATVALYSVLGSSWIAWLAQGFAFFAVVTSFLAQGLSLSHFLADGMKIGVKTKRFAWLCLLALAPPLLFALFDPGVFFKALGFAGGICAMILFGFLPIFMIWEGRYRKRLASSYHVAGGKASLALAFLFSALVLGCELVRLIPF